MSKSDAVTPAEPFNAGLEGMEGDPIELVNEEFDEFEKVEEFENVRFI